MKTIVDQRAFAWAEVGPQLPSTNFDYENEINWMTNSVALADPTALQLSSTLIRIGQQMQDNGSNLSPVSYEFRLAGSGLSPVSSLSALLTAIDNGIANGNFSRVDLLRAGVDVLRFDFSAAGYVITSGAQSIKIDGALPINFDQLFDLAGLAAQVSNLGGMSVAARTAFFADLGAYGISGLSFHDGATAVFAFHVSATDLTLTIGDTTIHLSGTFPTDFGQVVETAWEISQQTGPIDFTALSHLNLTAMELSSGGHTLLTLSDIPGPDQGYFLSGQKYGEMIVDTPAWVSMSYNYDWVTHTYTRSIDSELHGAGGYKNSILAGLDGNDTLLGFSGRDALFGGSGKDVLNGGAGNDLLSGGSGRDEADFFGSAVVTVDLRMLTAQFTGQGMDRLTGIEDVSSGSAGDLLIGDDRGNRLQGFDGGDTLRGAGGDDTLVGGNDRDYLRGGAGSDVFLFRPGEGADTVVDYEVGTDHLRFDSDNGAWAHMTPAEFLSHYASVANGHVVFSFGSGNRVVLDGIASLAGLDADLTLV